jgi:peptide deformylase
MPARRILQLGDPMLRLVSEPVREPAMLWAVLRDLDATLSGFRRTHGFGRGISAIQIGEPVRIIFLEVEGVAYSLLNPEYCHQSEERFELWDDCFSFPDLMVRVSRHRRVAVRYLNEKGQPCALEASGAMSELIQHEMDHLDGILAVDRAIDQRSLATREQWLRRSPV